MSGVCLCAVASTTQSTRMHLNVAKILANFTVTTALIAHILSFCGYMAQRKRKAFLQERKYLILVILLIQI